MMMSYIIEEFAGFRYTYPAASVVEIRYFSITSN
jgi:hypothetical protein